MPKDIRKVAMGASLLVAVLMLSGKLFAYFITGSRAIFSDAAESVVHIAATAVAAASLWYATRPADRDHLYGHGKIAYFSAGFEGAFILVAALAILIKAVEALILGPELHRLGIGLLITGALGLVNLALGLFLIRVGRRHNSIILEANGKHVLTDMWTSLAVVGGVALVWVTDLVWLDPVVAILAALNILASAMGLIRRSVDGLLDRADPIITRTLVETLEKEVVEGQITGFHALRHRATNDEIWIEAHLLIPGSTSTFDAHAEVTRVEDELRKLFPDQKVFITSHVEPSDHDAAHPDGHEEIDDPLVNDSGEIRGGSW